MPGVTQPTERPGTYQQKFDAIMAQMKGRRRAHKMKSEDWKEYEVIIKEALRKEAIDKIEFSLRGELRRGRAKKMGMTETEFSDLWRKKMKDRLQKDGYIFVLTPAEKKLLDGAREKMRKAKIQEMTTMAAEAMKKLVLEA